MQHPSLTSLLMVAALCVAATPAGHLKGPQSEPLGTGSPHDPATPSGSFVVRCARLILGDGASVDDAWMVVRNGKVESIGTFKNSNGAMPADLPLLDVRDKVVMPGIVAADTDLALGRDSEYNVTPDFVALDGFPFEQEFHEALSGGVTTAFVGVGRSRLLPGQGSVVKLAGSDIVERALDESASLQLTLGTASTQAPWIFEPTVSPTSDDPLTPAVRQYPTARISQLATLRTLFDDAQRTDFDAGRESSRMVENQYDSQPLRDVVAGRLPLRIAAREAADILRGIRFAKRLGAKCILEDPYELEQIAPRIAAAGVPAVLRMPVAISSSNSGGENRRNETVHNRPDNAAIAARAGIPFALTTARDDDLADFLFITGIAIRHGLDPAVALRAITSEAAKTLGVDDRVGTLRAGMDADFVVLSGEPFAVGTMVEKTFVDGAPAFERETTANLIAIRAGRVLTVDGPVLRNATILIGDGKIKAVGEELAIPYGARIIDLPDAVVTPGLIDSFTSAGLSGDGTGIPRGSLDQRIGDVLRADDAVFDAARQSGLTTLLVSGTDGSGVSGRITAVKTALDQNSLVLREIAGLRIVHDAIGADAIKPVRDLFARGKKYIDSWKNYEKKRADWEAAQAKAKEEAKDAPAEEEAEPSAADPVSGTWECELSNLPIPIDIELEITLKLVGKKVTGTVIPKLPGNQTPPPLEISNGRFEDGVLTGEVSFGPQGAKFEATIEDDKLNGTIEAGGREVNISGERTSKTAKKKVEDKGPQKPTIDESLEPVRAVIENRAVAVVRTERAPAMQDVIEFFTKEKYPFVLHGVADAIDTPGLLGETPPPVLLGPTLVEREKGAIVNGPARLADRGVELAFGTGDAMGTRYLPLHTAHAIRWGLDPQAALEALTLDAAKMFKIDDRVGSITRGKDADLVVFSGNPFELTSRVLLVICDGRVVVDERTEGNNR